MTPLHTDVDTALDDLTIYPSIRFVLQGFRYSHLPPEKQAVSKLFAGLALELVHRVPHNAELTVALRDLLTSKDAAVRATFFKNF